MFGKLIGALHRESLAKVIRTFIIAFLAITVPGVLGWLHELTEWASGQGQTPFPDAHSLGFLAVSGSTAGFVALLNLVWLYVEDLTGKGFLRDPSADKKIAPRPIAEGGHIAVPVNLPALVAAAWTIGIAVVLAVPWLLHLVF